MKYQLIVTTLTILFLSFNLSAQTNQPPTDKVSKKTKANKDKNLFIQDAGKEGAKYDIKCQPQEKVLKAYNCSGSDGKIAKHCTIVKGKGYVGNDKNMCKGQQKPRYSCNDFTLCAIKDDFKHPSK